MIASGCRHRVRNARLSADDTIDFVIVEPLGRKTRMGRRPVGGEDHTATIADMAPEAFHMLLTNSLPNA